MRNIPTPYDKPPKHPLAPLRRSYGEERVGWVILFGPLLFGLLVVLTR